MTQKILVTDIDGVILDWETRFHEWMREKGFSPVLPAPPTYNLDVHYHDLSVDQTLNLLEEFNESINMINLKPFKDAAYGMKWFHEHGYMMIAITAAGNHPMLPLVRSINLERRFGDIFHDVRVVGINDSKIEHLMDVFEPGAIWVEDNLKNALVGADIGYNTFLMDHPHNKDFSDSRVTRVDGWTMLIDKGRL